MDVNTSTALEQALTAMSHQELLNLILKLSGEEADFRRILLANVNISPQILQQQPRNLQVAREYKRQIGNFFNEFQERANYDPYYADQEYDEEEEYSELDSLLENVKTLNPADQIDIFWHTVICGNEVFENGDFLIGTPQIEEAIGLYGEAVSKLELTHQDKRPHFDALIDALSWSMCGYGNVTDAIEDALDTICSVPEDYRYLIQQFQSSDYARSSDLIAEYYLDLGEDENYLQIREANLQNESQYLQLAEFWQQKGEQEKYLATLEKWVSDLPQKRNKPQDNFQFFYRPSYSSLDSSPILQRLADHYRHQQDDENLCRILMTLAEYGETTLDLYKQIENLSTPLGKWQEFKPQLIKFARQDSNNLAQIYLYEQDWDAAIQLAQQRSDYYDERLKILVAEGVKEHRTEASIQIYQQLLQNHIERKNREHYQIAARHANAIKSIYLSVLNDSAAWQHYITDIRQRYPRHRALQEELRGL
ncbi:MAG: hypothetical protein AB1861_16635 [Cyanobacteriota bacterium]